MPGLWKILAAVFHLTTLRDIIESGTKGVAIADERGAAKGVASRKTAGRGAAGFCIAIAKP